MQRKFDVLVISEGSLGGGILTALPSQVPAGWLVLPGADTGVACIGRSFGECWGDCLSRFGEAKARALWRLSEDNLKAVESLGKGNPLPLFWFGTSPIRQQRLRESEAVQGAGTQKGGKQGLLEQGWRISQQELAAALRQRVQECGFPIYERSAFHLRRRKAFEVQVTAPDLDLEAKMVILVGNRCLLETFPDLAEFFVPITLSEFHYTGTLGTAEAWVHADGPDFGIPGPSGFTLKSFRNLQTDWGVGFRDALDLVSKQALEQFFALRGAQIQKVLHAQTHFTTLSCDGLPVVGAFPAWPEVIVVSGFAGNEANFCYGLGPLLAAALQGKRTPELELLSPKRM